MKRQILALSAIVAVLAFNTAQAANPDGCYWYTGGSGSQKRYFTMVAPSNIELKSAPVGSVMATAPKAIIHTEIWQIKCSYPKAPVYHAEYYVADRELADGFTDVYKSGIPGVGVRFKSVVSTTTATLPLTRDSPNGDRIYVNVIKSIELEFIRTSRDVGQGAAAMNFRIEQDINGWNAAQILVNGNTKVETRSYFSGCAGVQKLNIPMGRVAIGEIGKQQKSFNLDVLCTGMPAGTKIPVRVYFEGNAQGPGRLNLDPGGAKGVEIALSNGKGSLLPFTKGGALSMDWISSQPGGELYRLPVTAAYARKGSQKVEVGAANATLNYIIEYD